MRTLIRGALLALLALGLHACSEASTNLTISPQSGNDASAPDDGSTAPPEVDARMAEPPDAEAADAGPGAMCGDKLCQCNDGKDNDRDGLADGIDPECTASFDDREETFATGRPRGGPNMCQDCFWDGNTMTEDDRCSRAPSCVEDGTVAMAGPAAMCGTTCDVEADCVEGCRKYTPNGCDCFGCCDVTRADGTSAQLMLGDECSLAVLDDMAKCPPCVKNTQCENPCGRCELCLGRPMSELPADCELASEEPQHACDDGATCTETTLCPVDYYCVLGCCIPALL